MSGPYDDIINLPHHVSERHPRMPMIDRAAQFSPFAALTGYDAAVKETARLTDPRTELDEDAKAELDEKLRKIADAAGERPTIRITYFLPDDRKAGGAYIDKVGQVKRLDSKRGTILMLDGTTVSVEDIFDIDLVFLTDAIEKFGD